VKGGQGKGGSHGQGEVEDLAAKNILAPFQARFRRDELIVGGGIGKESRKGTGLWHSYTGKEVVERPLGRESMAFAASSQRIGSTQPFLPRVGSVVECGFR